MEHKVLRPSSSGYPARLARRLGGEAPDLYFSGPIHLLGRMTLAVAAADSIPAQAIFATNQLLFAIREFGINFIGGWHSVMEMEIFRIALDRRNDPVGMRSLTLFTARGMRPESWEGFLADRFGLKGPFTGFPEKGEFFRRAEANELLVMSVTQPEVNRMTRASIMARNLTACALADAVFVPFAAKGTKTYTLCKRVLSIGIPIFAPKCVENHDLEDLGVVQLDQKVVGAFLENAGATRGGPPAFPADHSKPVADVVREAVSPPLKKSANDSQIELFDDE